jgi:hypothetical protein
MSTLIDKPLSAALEGGRFVIRLSGGQEVAFPVADNPRLAAADEAELLNFELSPFGVHWPALDEDLSISGLLEGDWGQGQSGKVDEN